MSAKPRAAETRVRGRLGSAGGGVGSGQVSDIQRARMLSAMVEVVVERGVRNTSVAHVVAHSSVSRRTFYEVFDDREDCFLATFDDVIAKIAAVVVPAYEREAGWREQIRAGLTSLLEFFDCERSLARFAIVDALGAGPQVLERRARALVAVVDAVDRGRAESELARDLPRLTAESVVGAVLSVLHTRLLSFVPASAGRGGCGQASCAPLVELVNPLMGIVVLPYLGSTVSRRELERATPRRRAAQRHSALVDPLRDLEMRLTYRTVRVLVAVADNPRSSNRMIAAVSGITDQGQISKLLTRLHGLGLVENVGACATRGEPNEWCLSAKGRELHGMIAGKALRA